MILAVSIILKDYCLVNIGWVEMIIIRSSFVHYYSTLFLLILPDFFHNSYFLECPASPLLTENHPDSPVHPVKRQKPVMSFQYRAIIILLFPSLLLRGYHLFRTLSCKDPYFLFQNLQYQGSHTACQYKENQGNLPADSNTHIDPTENGSLYRFHQSA